MISTIVPCFNAERYLGAALASLLGQSLSTDEIIVVDDGSTDSSVEIANAFGARIRVISQPNLGVSAARNRGIAESQGNLITFLDADDLKPTRAHEQLCHALTADAALSVGVVEQFVSEEVGSDLAAFMDVPPPQVGRLAGAFIVRRTVFDQIGLFDTTVAFGETMDWFSRFESAGLGIRWTTEAVLRRRLHAANSVHKRERLKSEYLKVLRQDVARRRLVAP